ncbi:uncharacterized protein LOC131050968 isoform X2 [Cryptomeria japonica]|uniref:uncharacterized protein LOC131050968 isoform X2 n=1 Tax=Cryptomeria japonica TaxID=3369 RepID=UPI0025AC4439|nr:uncharacterized protein LOC131050968 isoform X2 [Cryptomeria japonica]
MTDDAEKRFERAMDKLFHPKLSSSATSLDSSPGTSSPKELANSVHKAMPGQMSKGPSSSRISPQPRRLSGSNLKSTLTSTSSPAPMCRPWDRRDLVRRLATFKSMTWFGKPKVVGPVNCARRGWVNVDIDLIACEACCTRLSFSTPPTWTKQQVESAATLFSTKLVDGHKSHCPWKGNECEETLAHFPPTPAPALVESYRDRCDALFQLPALPVVSFSAIEQMKISRGPQIDRLLAQPPPLPMSLLSRYSGKRSDIEIMSNESTLTPANLYYQAQRIISLCGWEPRLLPYIVDCEDYSSEIVKEASPRLSHAHSPSVLLRSKSRAIEVAESPINKYAGLQEMPDPASIVLDCTLCGASVGMWTFSTIYRPLQLTYDSVESQNFCKKTNESGVCGLSAASCIGGISTSEDKGKEHLDDVGEGMTSTCQKNASDERVLDLSLTIAGGLPPTKQNSSSLLPLPSITQFKAGFPSGSEVGERVTSTESPKAQEKMQFTRQHGNSVNSRRDITESISINREGIDTAGSSKRKRIEGNRSERVNDTDGNTRNKRKRDGAIIGERCVQELGSSEYHGFSSVNAVDTCYRDRKENSTDSVDNIPHYLCKSDEGIEEGTGTNIATLSTGRIGGTSVGMSVNATQIDAHGEVCGNDISVNRAESRAAESEVLVETARSVQRSEIVSRGDKPHNVSICEDSQHALLVDQAVADITSSKDSLANGVIMDFRAGGERSEVCEPTEVSEKQEKSDSVMPGPHNCAKIDDVVISNSGIDSEQSPRGKGMEFDSIRQHRHFCPWVHVIGGILGSDQNTGLCGWQLTIDALDQCNAQELASASLKESESTSSRYKVNPVASVRHLFETPSKKTKRSHVHSTNDS